MKSAICFFLDSSAIVAVIALSVRIRSVVSCYRLRCSSYFGFIPRDFALHIDVLQAKHGTRQQKTINKTVKNQSAVLVFGRMKYRKALLV